MKENCAFTICSKNYLAQAITLRNSFIHNNPNLDFYLFLADGVTDDIRLLDVVELDEEWIPKWKEMAFKYDVIEFNTSIKPFCFKKLFNEGYNKVIYLDPDIYVIKSLSQIYLWLDTYHVVLTPHVCHMELNYTGAQFDGSVLNVGLYNLGFCALRKSEVGLRVTEWWMDRLEKYCYGTPPLFVDQKWMMFIPLFFPKETLVTKHAGINTAIWNLHERKLIIDEGEYKVIDVLGDEYPLLFFHFSGFDPDVPNVINRRHPEYNIKTYPSFKPIIEEYRSKVFDNGYNKFHSMTYKFVSFNNHLQLTGFHRLLFRRYLELFPNYRGNPFSEKDEFYKILENRKLLIKTKSDGKAINRGHIKQSDSIQQKYIIPILKVIKKIVGIKGIMKIRGLANRLSDRNVYNFLLDD